MLTKNVKKKNQIFGKDVSVKNSTTKKFFSKKKNAFLLFFFNSYFFMENRHTCILDPKN